MCELDIIFNFEKAYFILDEFVICGEVQETSKASVAKSLEEADSLQEVRFVCLCVQAFIFLLCQFGNLCFVYFFGRQWRSI